MATSTDKTRENRLRRMAARQGLQLVKSRLRDSRALGFGGYMIVDPRTTGVLAGASPVPHSLDLDDVEEYLTRS